MIQRFRGHSPIIHPAARLAANATLVGCVTVEAASSIWYGAVLRGDSGTLTIGENTNIQDNAVLHCDAGGKVLLGRNVTVGHCALVHGCTVGDDSLIGMHATLLNHSVVGKRCIIGAGALVPEGMVIPDDSVAVGIPARVIKKITPEQLEHNRANAASYVEEGKAHAEAQKERT